jgi:hypothetical protein
MGVVFVGFVPEDHGEGREVRLPEFVEILVVLLHIILL